MKKATMLSMLVLLAMASFAQTRRISGKIVDKRNRTIKHRETGLEAPGEQFLEMVHRNFFGNPIPPRWRNFTIKTRSHKPAWRKQGKASFFYLFVEKIIGAL